MPGGESFLGLPPPTLAGPRRPPRVVYAAALLTWITATGSSAMTVLFTVSLLWLGAPLFDAFRSGGADPRWFLVEAAGVVVVLSAAADLAAVFVVRGHKWARWALTLLSLVAAVGGVMAAYYIAPLLITAASVTVVVLLFLAPARAWFRTSYAPRTSRPKRPLG